MLNYGYSSFELEIIEYCDSIYITEREQYYLNLLKPEYNILKYARSLKGFKHKNTSIELIRKANLGRRCSESVKLKLALSSITAQSVNVIEDKTKEIKDFTSIRKAAKYIGVHPSYLVRCLTKKGFLNIRGYTIKKR